MHREDHDTRVGIYYKHTETDNIHTAATSNHPPELKKAVLRYKLDRMKHPSHFQVIKNNKTVTLLAHNSKHRISHVTPLYVTSILAACPAHCTLQHFTTVTTIGGLYKLHIL